MPTGIALLCPGWKLPGLYTLGVEFLKHAAFLTLAGHTRLELSLETIYGSRKKKAQLNNGIGWDNFFGDKERNSEQGVI